MTFEEARDKYIETRLLYNSLVTHMERVRKVRDEKCPHTEAVNHTDYFPASYYDKASWETYRKCAVCGKHMSEHVVSTLGY